MAWNRLSASRSLPRAREYTRNLVFGNFVITMLRYFTCIKCKEYINFATLMFPLQKRWKFLFYALLFSSSCILDLSDLRQYRRFVWKLPLPGLHFATAATRSFVLAAETRSSFSCDCLLRDDTSCWHTTASYLRQYVSPSGILHRVSNRKYRFASARLGLLAPFYPKERDTIGKRRESDKIFDLFFGIRERFSQNNSVHRDTRVNVMSFAVAEFAACYRKLHAMCN